jgi:hypothetical protein
MNQKKIERKLKELCNDSNLFFQHGANAGKILWYDNDEKQWCVNTFTADEDKVYISPMPIETFN